MSSPSVHPRRRAQRLSSPNIRKSETFSARTGLRSDLCNPRDNASFLPKRSHTTLEDLVMRDDDLIALRQSRVAQYLMDVDEAIKSDQTDAGVEILNEQQVLAVPELMVNKVIVPEFMDIDEKKPVQANHQHSSDSGLGSSVDTPYSASRTLASARSSAGSTLTSHSAITRSFSAESTLPQNSGPELSSAAWQHIKDRILAPILNNPSLKEYHPLIKSIPGQVDSKFIANLRDLEKTLLYETPRFSLSSESFTKFWELSIECLHTTVDFLADRDQKRPTDRPYTNNYFLDLVEQIRRYAEIMARTRQKKEDGEELDDNDYTPGEKISIRGGLSHNGKPAEIVRTKDGKTMSLVPEGYIDDTMSIGSKRRFEDDDEFDDDVLRSMARRRKSDKAGDVMHVCSTCRKEFKRPCDLTKHEKTHSRPFKCSEPSCSYHERGWPTEKEMQRHMNDKHMAAPTLYQCHFKPCPYTSKRESNCKQHMEKAHGWTYVRSKSNGRKRESVAGSVSMTPTTPMTPFETTTPAVPTPESLFTPSPMWTSEHTFGFGESSNAAANRRDSSATAHTHFTLSSGVSPHMLQANFGNGVEMVDHFDHNSPLFTNNPHLDLGAAFDNAAMDNMLRQTMAMQQPTPALSNGDDFALDTTLGAFGNQQNYSPVAQNFSPTGQDALFYSASTSGDEGFGEVNSAFQAAEDFVLFPQNASSHGNMNMETNWFNDNSATAMGGTLDFNYDEANMFPQ